jgi:TRAP-type mannitol/chloroaromatic compound transport system permease small subunit
MWDEGSGTGGYIWLMMGTLPVGFALFIIGLVVGIIRKLRK